MSDLGVSEGWREFQPGNFLQPKASAKARRSISLIILNQPIHHFERFCKIWAISAYRICADGGANRLYDVLVQHDRLDDSKFLPDLIHGDLDSLRNDVRTYFERKSVAISFDGDEYSTDFQKAIQVLGTGHAARSKRNLQTPLNFDSGSISLQGEIHDVIVSSTLGGRVDQALGLVHEMYRETKAHMPGSSRPLRLWLLSEQAISFVLPTGTNSITGIRPGAGIFEKHVGILPLYGEAEIDTQGFEWDVQAWPTSMGRMVSTSNHVLGDEVKVIVRGEMVLFTIELTS